MRTTVALLALVLVFASAAPAQQVSLVLASTECLRNTANPNDTRVHLPGSSAIQVEIRAFAPAGGAKIFEFALPEFATAPVGVVFLTPNPAAESAVGNPFGAGGARISFANCQGASFPVTLYSALLIVSSASNVIVPWTVTQHASPTLPGTCAAAARCTAEPTVCMVGGQPEQILSTPSNPSPADGATGVSYAPLTYAGLEGGGCLCGGVLCVSWWFGTDPDPPLYYTVCDLTPPLTRPALAPNTTYYWRAGATYCATGIGPVWSFTTGDVVGVDPSTWGDVKRHFR